MVVGAGGRRNAKTGRRFLARARTRNAAGGRIWSWDRPFGDVVYGRGINPRCDFVSASETKARLTPVLPDKRSYCFGARESFAVGDAVGGGVWGGLGSD